MRIFVYAKPGAKLDAIRVAANEGKRIFYVSTRERTRSGKANRAICALIAEYFNVPISKVLIISGLTGKRKVLTITI